MQYWSIVCGISVTHQHAWEFGCNAGRLCWVFKWPTKISRILSEILVNWWGI